MSHYYVFLGVSVEYLKGKSPLLGIFLLAVARECPLWELNERISYRERNKIFMVTWKQNIFHIKYGGVLIPLVLKHFYMLAKIRVVCINNTSHL